MENNCTELINELKWRGFWSQTSGNLGSILSKPTSFYIGIDPTASSLGVHHTVGLMAARVLQKYGHRPIILVGEATSSIGDPSGKSQERKSISKEEVAYNTKCVMKQIEKFLDFNSDEPNAAVMVNNIDWLGSYTFLDFIRDIGKNITVNYMMAKENVKKRLEREGSGISFQEFSYGLLQGYDFVHLYKEYGCQIQISGTDNIGNICTGMDLIHKMLGKDDVGSISWELLTCADGRKFGKTEGNAVWLDADKTSPYDFYQFWINQSDEDAKKFIKMFTTRSIDEINDLIDKHNLNPSSRLLQKELAKDMTILVHSEEDYNSAVAASDILFGKCTKEKLKSTDGKTILSVFKDVPKFNVSEEVISNGINFTELVCTVGGLCSKSEFRKMTKAGGITVNKEKITNSSNIVSKDDFIDGKYMVVGKGKKYSLFVTES